MALFSDDEIEDWTLARFEVCRYIETIREQRLHHEPHLIFSRVILSPGFNIKMVRRAPSWQLFPYEIFLLVS